MSDSVPPKRVRRSAPTDPPVSTRASAAALRAPVPVILDAEYVHRAWLLPGREIEVRIDQGGFRGTLGCAHYKASVLIADWLDAPEGAEIYLNDEETYPRQVGEDVLVQYDTFVRDDAVPDSPKQVEWVSACICRPYTPATPPNFLPDLKVGEVVETWFNDGWCAFMYNTVYVPKRGRTHLPHKSRSTVEVVSPPPSSVRSLRAALAESFRVHHEP